MLQKIIIVISVMLLSACGTYVKEIDIGDGNVRKVIHVRSTNGLQTTTTPMVLDCKSDMSTKCRDVPLVANVTDGTNVLTGAAAAAVVSYGGIEAARHLSKKGPNEVNNSYQTDMTDIDAVFTNDDSIQSDCSVNIGDVSGDGRQSNDCGAE